MTKQRNVAVLFDERVQAHNPEVEEPFLPGRLERRVREILKGLDVKWSYPEHPGRLTAIMGKLQNPRIFDKVELIVSEDFAAAPFQLLAQVAGRAGRSDLGGRIVVQTEAPSHPAVIHAAAHDYDAFAQAEDEIRSALSYPPHGRLIRVVFESEVEQAVTQAAANLAAALREALEGSGAMVLGLALAPFALLRGRHRHHLMVKVPDDEAVRRATEALKRLAAAEKSVAVKVDVDAVSML